MDSPTTTRILVALTGLHGLVGGGGIAGHGDDGDRLGREMWSPREVGGGKWWVYMFYICCIHVWHYQKNKIKSNFKDKLSVKRLPESYRTQKFQPSQEGVENHKTDHCRKGKPGEMPGMVASGI